MKRLFVGVDTSNYTTSVAAALENGEIIANIKRLLPVASGERGLRQSDAVFSHVKAMPEVLGELSEILNSYPEELVLEGVGYSSAPREVEGSYMPCFLVGESVARSMAADRNLPVFASSHQAGHIMAALYSANAMHLLNDRFAAFHVSGGTTEIVLVSPHEERIISADVIGGTLDLNAGQLIDRVGVLMGESFPAGRFLDQYAVSFDGDFERARINVKDLSCNLSGAENKAREVFEKMGDKARVAAFTLDFVARTICKLSENLREKYPDIPIVYAGGVMSSEYIKSRLSSVGAYFASPKYSSDNAAGCALLCLEKWRRSQKERG